jgi:hypothetical protein
LTPSPRSLLRWLRFCQLSCRHECRISLPFDSLRPPRPVPFVAPFPITTGPPKDLPIGRSVDTIATESTSTGRGSIRPPPLVIRFKPISVVSNRFLSRRSSPFGQPPTSRVDLPLTPPPRLAPQNTYPSAKAFDTPRHGVYSDGRGSVRFSPVIRITFDLCLD